MKTVSEVLAEIDTANRQAIALIVEALDRAGYVIVPKEPTKEMVRAISQRQLFSANAALVPATGNAAEERAFIGAVATYTAMIEARPK